MVHVACARVAAVLFLCATLCIMCARISFASTTDGTIDSTDKWAWSESVGWIDFGTSGGNVHVSDSALTGYAYGENIGWISLNCSNTSSCGDNNYMVANDGSGNLSGYAWSESTGWINFAPSAGGVEVSSSGVFSGTAYGENIGWIVFSTDHPVTTDWRPSSARSSGTNTSAIANGPPLGTLTNLPYMPGLWATQTAKPTPTTTVPTIHMPKTTSTPPFTQSRRMGETGADIKKLQIFLNTHGFPIAASGAGSRGYETTYFGALTRRALAAFQKAQGIEPPAGYFGPLTREYINSHY